MFAKTCTNIVHLLASFLITLYPNTMTELRLEIKSDPAIYSELYFKDGYRSIWEYVKKAALTLLLFCVAAIAVFVLSSSNMDTTSLVLLAIACLGIIVSFVRLMIRVEKYRRWKAPIDAYIADITRYRSYRIVLTPASVEMQLDGVSHIEKLEHIVHSSIDPEYISFGNSASPTKYLIPRKSVRQHEFEQLKNFLREMIRHSNPA
jgi:hypothetical protein